MSISRFRNRNSFSSHFRYVDTVYELLNLETCQLYILLKVQNLIGSRSYHPCNTIVSCPSSL
nr:hypothetical protein Iba_scaffold18461CG0060 [Ipomoea batatas]